MFANVYAKMLHILCDAKGSPKPKSIHLIDCRLWLHLGLQPTGNIWHQDGCFLAGVRVWFLNLFLWSNLNPFVFFFKALTLPLSFQQPTCECLFPSLLTSLAFWSSLTFGKNTQDSGSICCVLIPSWDSTSSSWNAQTPSPKSFPSTFLP